MDVEGTNMVNYWGKNGSDAIQCSGLARKWDRTCSESEKHYWITLVYPPGVLLEKEEAWKKKR